MKKVTALLVFLSATLFACGFEKDFTTFSAIPTPTNFRSISLTQLSKPIITQTVSYISRESYDFLPSPTSTPLPTPTNIFSPVKDLNEYKDLVIVLDRSYCFGSCPDYKLTISGNGKGVFDERGADIQHFTVTKSQLDELVKAFESIHYFSFNDYYAVPITDMQTVITSITFQGLSKEVRRYGFCIDYDKIVLLEGESKSAAPQQICDLEDKIDKIVNTSQWIGH